jgi:tetratricopeptide (TPR) repeat protein
MAMSFRSRLTPDRGVLIGLLLATGLYCQDFRYDFILDDVPLILTNQTITNWHNWKAIFLTHIFSTGSTDVPQQVMAIHYRPVYVLWLMLNSQLFGAVLPWWHLTSLLLHMGVTILVYELGLQVFKESWTAALAAFLFALHPIHVESVSYVSASTDLLVTFFLLGSFLLYSHFRERGASSLYLVASVLAAGLAVLSKETAVVFPALLVAYEALGVGAPKSTQGWKRFLWTLPFFAVVAAYAVVRSLLFGFNAGPGPGGERLAALRDAPLVLLVYLRNLAWPFHLSFFYPVEWSSIWSVWKLCGLVLALAVAVWLWHRYRGDAGVRLQLLWGALLLAIPMAGVWTFVRDDWVHDRHMYLVSVPVCLIAAGLLRDLKVPFQARNLAIATVLLILLVETAVQVPRFRDGESVYASALQVDPNSAFVHSEYAFALWTDGHRDEALREFRVTTDLSPRLASAHNNYGTALAEIGRDAEAETQFALALRWSRDKNPFRAFLLYELAEVELKHSDAVDATNHLQEAIQIAPQAMSYHALLAQALRQQGRRQEADEQMRFEASIRAELPRTSALR